MKRTLRQNELPVTFWGKRIKTSRNVFWNLIWPTYIFCILSSFNYSSICFQRNLVGDVLCLSIYRVPEKDSKWTLWRVPSSWNDQHNFDTEEKYLFWCWWHKDWWNQTTIISNFICWSNFKYEKEGFESFKSLWCIKVIWFINLNDNTTYVMALSIMKRAVCDVLKSEL